MSHWEVVALFLLCVSCVLNSVVVEKPESQWKHDYQSCRRLCCRPECLWWHSLNSAVDTPSIFWFLCFLPFSHLNLISQTSLIPHSFLFLLSIFLTLSSSFPFLSVTAVSSFSFSICGFTEKKQKAADTRMVHLFRANDCPLSKQKADLNGLPQHLV